MPQLLDNVSETLVEVLSRILPRIIEGMQPDEIFLFGSHAYGKPTQASDVDLLIVVPESSEPGYRRAQRAYRCVGSVGVGKDLLVMTREEFERQSTVASSLARQVKKRGTLIYDRREAD